MKTTTERVEVGDTPGYLLESTLGDGVCFVPGDCLRFEAFGKVTLNEVAYVLSGWARKNGFLNPFIGGHRLFPNSRVVACDYGEPLVTQFLGRLRYLYTVSTSAA